MLKNTMPVLQYRTDDYRGVMIWEAYCLDNGEYSLTWRDLDYRGGFVAFRSTIQEIKNLIPRNALELVS